MSARVGVLLRWRTRIAWRALRAYAFGSLEGRVMLLVALLALPSLWGLAMGGAPVGRLAVEGAERTGALVLSHALLALCYLVMVPVHLVRVFVLDQDREPLHAHPWVLGELRVLQVVSGLLWPAVYLWAFYYLFFARALAGGAGPFLLALHFGAGTLWLVGIGVGGAALGRGWVAGADVRRRARVARRLAIVPFLATFALFASLPLALTARSPETLAWIGERAGSALHWGQAPVAIVDAVGEGRAGALALWSGAVIGLAAYALRSVWRWRERALEEIPLDLEAGAPHRYASGFARSAERHSHHAFRAFWIKDVVLPIRRAPLEYAQGLVPAGSALALAVAGQFALDRGRLAIFPSADAILGGGLVLAVGWSALWHAVGALGRERGTLLFLRPRLSPSRLFAMKLGVSVAHALARSFGLAVALALTLRALGLPSLEIGLAVEAITLGGVLGGLGCGLGFLFPGFGARSGSLPGVSTVARVLYPPACALVAGSYAALRQLGDGGALPELGIRAALGGIVLVVLVTTAAVGWLGVRRLDRREA